MLFYWVITRHLQLHHHSSSHHNVDTGKWGGEERRIWMFGDSCCCSCWAGDINSNVLTRDNISCPRYTTNKHKTCNTIANWTPLQQTLILQTWAQLSSVYYQLTQINNKTNLCWLKGGDTTHNKQQTNENVRMKLFCLSILVLAVWEILCDMTHDSTQWVREATLCYLRTQANWL